MEQKLVIIEGVCDWIGKTTQYEKIAEQFQREKIDILYHHFPSYNTVQGSLVENYLNGKYGNKDRLSPYLINSLFAIDRAITWQELKKSSSKLILFDRYTTSSLIYQAALIDDVEDKKRFIDFVIDYEYNKLEIRKPDVVIFLYASFDLVLKLKEERKQNEGIINDIHERDLDYLQKVYDNAMFVADYLSWKKVKCDNEKGMRDIMDIHKEIDKIIKDMMI